MLVAGRDLCRPFFEARFEFAGQSIGVAAGGQGLFEFGFLRLGVAAQRRERALSRLDFASLAREGALERLALSGGLGLERSTFLQARA